MVDVIEEQKQFFDDVISFCKNDKISHAYLIESRNYFNINDVISYFVRFLYSSKHKIYDLDKLISLDDINNDGNYIEINNDGSVIKKDQVIEIQEKYCTKSLNDNYRIYVIFNADRMNETTANSLLKFIEDPNDNIIGILVSDNRYSVLETIRSRCQNLFLLNNVFSISIEEDLLINIINCFEKYKEKSIAYLPISINNEYYSKDKWYNIFDSIRIIYEKALRFMYFNDDCDEFFSSIIKYICENNTREDILNKITVLSKYMELLSNNLNISLMLDRFCLEFNGVDIDD